MNKSEISNISYDFVLDACGLRCPRPLLLTKQRISIMTNQDTLLVIATDPSFIVDCRVFVRQTGHILLQSWQEGEKYFFILQRKSE